jgi:hypothetical protein
MYLWHLLPFSHLTSAPLPALFLSLVIYLILHLHDVPSVSICPSYLIILSLCSYLFSVTSTFCASAPVLPRRAVPLLLFCNLTFEYDISAPLIHITSWGCTPCTLHCFYYSIIYFPSWTSKATAFQSLNVTVSRLTGPVCKQPVLASSIASLLSQLLNAGGPNCFSLFCLAPASAVYVLSIFRSAYCHLTKTWPL